MKIVIVSDAWHPQINGVVRVLDVTRRELQALGHEVHLITPDMFRQIPLPTYPDIKLATFPYRRLSALLGDIQPDALHVMTEGPLGWAASKYCRKHGCGYTSSWLSKFPEYISVRTKIPPRWVYKWLANFHNQATQTMVTTKTMEESARAIGIKRVVRWQRGVNLSRFRPLPTPLFSELPKPILLYVGRIAPEKNIEAFLKVEVPGSKVVVGDGPLLSQLQKGYPDTHFTGALQGDDLAKAYSAADVLVFPSKTDTFGLVNLEAMACGVPVAAFPVTGPKDIIGEAPVGAMHDNLAVAIREALTLWPQDCITHAKGFSWQQATQDFLANLVGFRDEKPINDKSLLHHALVKIEHDPEGSADHQKN